MNVFLTNMQLLFSQTLTDGLEMCGLLWFFISCLSDSFWRHPFPAELLSAVWTLILTAPIHCRAVISCLDSHFDGTHSLQSCYQLFGLSFWRHPFTAELLSAVWTLILTAPIHCRAVISCLDSHFDGTHSLQSCYQLFGLSFWRHPFTAALRGQQFLKICSHKETDGLRRSTFSANFHFVWTIPLIIFLNDYLLRRIHWWDGDAVTFLQIWWRNKLIYNSDAN